MNIQNSDTDNVHNKSNDQSQPSIKEDTILNEMLGNASSGRTKIFPPPFRSRYINDEMSDKAYTNYIRQREELIRQNKKNYYPILALCVCTFTLLAVLLSNYLIISLIYNDNPAPGFIDFWKHHFDFIILYFILFLTLFIGLCANQAIKRHKKLSELEGYIYAYEHTKLTDSVKEDIYESSINMSYTYLDQYYKETRQQASRGFFITLTVSIIGAAIIIIGVLSMFAGVTQAAYITTASGVIVELISSIFFHLYNKTIQSMGNYHNKLVLSQNIAIALKLSESIEGPDKNTVKVDMIKALTANINNHINSNKPVD